MSEILQAFLNARISYRNSNRVRSIMQTNLALIMRNNNLARLVQARIAEALLAIVINPVEIGQHHTRINQPKEIIADYHQLRSKDSIEWLW